MNDWAPSIVVSQRTLTELIDIILINIPPQPALQNNEKEDLNNCLKELKAVGKYRRIIPIGRPACESVPSGVIFICDKCQHTTKRGRVLCVEDDGIANYYEFCSNATCNQDFSKCHSNYLKGIDKDSSIPKLEPIQKPHKEWNDVSICSRCHTRIPLENPDDLIHACWEDSQSECGAYYKKPREGWTVMICCQCTCECGLISRHQMVGEDMTEDDKYGYRLFYSQGCGHVEDNWNDCQDCVRLVEELPLGGATGEGELDFEENIMNCVSSGLDVEVEEY